MFALTKATFPVSDEQFLGSKDPYRGDAHPFWVCLVAMSG